MKEKYKMHGLETIIENNRNATSKELDEKTINQINEWKEANMREVVLNTQEDTDEDIRAYVVSTSTEEEMQEGMYEDFESPYGHHDGMTRSEQLTERLARMGHKVELKVISCPAPNEINEEIAFDLAQKWKAKYNGVEMDEINQVITLNA
jgi:hypothetical protein